MEQPGAGRSARQSMLLGLADRGHHLLGLEGVLRWRSSGVQHLGCRLGWGGAPSCLKRLSVPGARRCCPGAVPLQRQLHDPLAERAHVALLELLQRLILVRLSAVGAAHRRPALSPGLLASAQPCNSCAPRPLVAAAAAAWRTVPGRRTGIAPWPPRTWAAPRCSTEAVRTAPVSPSQCCPPGVPDPTVPGVLTGRPFVGLLERGFQWKKSCCWWGGLALHSLWPGAEWPASSCSRSGCHRAQLLLDQPL